MSLRSKITGICITAAVAAATVGVTGGAASASSASHRQSSHRQPAHRHPSHRHPSFRPSGRVLREGSRGSDVRALQRRLAALKYYPGQADGHFGANTLEAVWAFQEVNRIPASGAVGPRTRNALAHPRPYRAHDPRQAGTRVEINLGLGVLVLFVNHRIALVSHESSGGHYYYNGGAYAETPTGAFRAQRFIPGWDSSPLGELYNPVYFDGGYAIHGDTYVPVNPVSHGCVRLPMDIANWFHHDVRIGPDGTEVWIYNQW